MSAPMCDDIKQEHIDKQDDEAIIIKGTYSSTVSHEKEYS